MVDKESEKALVVFRSKKIRRAWFKDEWYYSLVDIVKALTDSANSTDYLKKMRKRDEELGSYLGTNCPHVEMLTETGKKRSTLAGNTKDVFRLIQSIPSKNAEPFKRWLAKVGKERIDEIENPELAQERMKEIYIAKGYPKDWIDKRLRGIAIRQNLTDEWKERGIEDQRDFAILTAEISKATFGMTPSEYKRFKQLPQKSKANLRDHMTSSNRLKSVVSSDRMQTIAQLNGISTRKTLNLNFSPSGRFGEAKSLMWVTLTCNSSQKDKRPPYTVEVVAMTKNKYPHFNPNTYGLDTKIATVRTGSHCKFNINYHIIWIPKYRRKLLTGKVAEVLRTILNGQCEDMDLDMLALEVMPDHIHLFVGAKPKHTPWKIVKQLKGNTSIQLRRCFKHLPYLLWNFGKRFPNLWAKGYYCGSAGHVSQEAVRRYILEQQGKDVFEYSIFGDPTGQSKIGQFAQTKLSSFGGAC